MVLHTALAVGCGRLRLLVRIADGVKRDRLRERQIHRATDAPHQIEPAFASRLAQRQGLLVMEGDQLIAIAGELSVHVAPDLATATDACRGCVLQSFNESNDRFGVRFNEFLRRDKDMSGDRQAREDEPGAHQIVQDDRLNFFEKRTLMLAHDGLAGRYVSLPASYRNAEKVRDRGTGDRLRRA